MKPVQTMTLAERMRQVEGWFSLEAALLFSWIDEVQRAHSIAGHCFEIGVHRGKSAILLSHLLRPGERLGVCDLFDEQSGNVSRSGSGDRAVFESNMERFGTARDRLAIFAKSSLALTAAEIGTGQRFFHVDGGHNADEALSDVRLAAECLVRGGVIVVDDPFRHEWPGVTEAIIRFLDERPDFSAVLVGFNKLVLVHSDSAAMYADSMDDRTTRAEFGLVYPWQLRTRTFMGRPLRIFYVPTRTNARSLRARVEQVHRSQPWSRTPAAEGVIRLARRILP